MFKHLLKNEPGVVELTQKQYEDYRTLEQSGAGSESPEDVGEVLEEAPVEGQSDYEEVSRENTNEEIKTVLRNRGFGTAQIRGKRKQELLDML
ncbi:MAG: hypothetical protein KAS32_20680 [Candidatus Peribacteraceae bacterium]|nr:hypothetical protein [Candidatus Peribacteraceae bacterium]